jgi:asparagine synthase (glutamine-hydrolysing)
MCGITGVLHLDCKPVSPAMLRSMTAALSHRGPDGDGCFVDGNLGLGHRRLAIIDISAAGNQPMVSADHRYALTYNGEIYNYAELRTELQKLGYTFRSRTDSEVLLYAFAAWGSNALNRFNGMFAFAIWDKHERVLFLGRDRYGIKPLYYTQQGDTFLFGSEIKAVIASSSYTTEIDKEALVEYFTFQNFFTDRTLFKGIRLLAPGCSLTIGEGVRRSVSITRYWDFCFRQPAHVADEREYVEELDSRFQRAVERQLVSDVEVGAYLSGGIDSGSITALASRQIPFIKSFTCGFDLHSASGLELASDERDGAEHMSYLLKTEHYEMVLKAGDMERVMPRLARHIEEPRVGQSYPNFYAAQLASKFVKVVLSGTGGDELFGGYPWRYYRAVVNDDFEHYIDKYYAFWNRLVPNSVIQQAFKPIWSDVKHVWTRNIFRDVFAAHAAELTSPIDYINHSLYFEAKTFLHGLLVMEDKLSMAHGLETRVPFLDNDLVDFAMQVPVSLKLGNLSAVIDLNENEPGPKTERYYQMTHDGKLLLRKVLQRYVPPEISRQPKRGFSAPDASWFKGDSIEYVKGVLFNPKARIYEYLHPGTIQGLVDDHIAGAVNRRLLIWSLVSFEAWCNTFLS